MTLPRIPDRGSWIRGDSLHGLVHTSPIGSGRAPPGGSVATPPVYDHGAAAVCHPVSCTKKYRRCGEAQRRYGCTRHLQTGAATPDMNLLPHRFPGWVTEEPLQRRSSRSWYHSSNVLSTHNITAHLLCLPTRSCDRASPCPLGARSDPPPEAGEDHRARSEATQAAEPRTL